MNAQQTAPMADAAWLEQLAAIVRQAGIEETIKKSVPEIKGIEAVTV